MVTSQRVSTTSIQAAQLPLVSCLVYNDCLCLSCLYNRLLVLRLPSTYAEDYLKSSNVWKHVLCLRVSLISCARPSTYNLRPSTYNLRPCTCNFRPSTYNFRPSTYSFRPSTYNVRSPIYNFRSSIYSFRPSTYNLRPSTQPRPATNLGPEKTRLKNAATARDKPRARKNSTQRCKHNLTLIEKPGSPQNPTRSQA